MSGNLKSKAEAQFQKAARSKDAKKASGEYQSEARKIQIKTERLKALRLEKEAADLKASADKKPPVRKKRVAAKSSPI